MAKTRTNKEAMPTHAGKDRLLLTAREAAAVCGKSLRTWRIWDSAGVIPRPVRISGSTMWRIEELRRWIDAGCPRREQWEMMQDESA